MWNVLEGLFVHDRSKYFEFESKYFSAFVNRLHAALYDSFATYKNVAISFLAEKGIQLNRRKLAIYGYFLTFNSQVI